MNRSRRDFIRDSACGLSMVTLATQVQHFGLLTALAQNADVKSGGDQYKALVLVFLSGGNDGNNTVVPKHDSGDFSNYGVYSAARGPQGLAIQRDSLLPITVPRMNGLEYGLHPSLGPVTGGINNGIHELWGLGKMAIVTNCGTLVRPMTKAQYLNGSVRKPYQLFSHSDQVAQSQTSISNTEAFTGWGGRVSDRLTAGSNPNGLIPMVTSIAGAQLFTAGQTTLPMAIANANTPLSSVLNPAGFTNVGGPARLLAFNELRSLDLDSHYIAAASNVTEMAMDANAALQGDMDVGTVFPTTGIGLQLKQVARIIQRRTSLNVNRQIFYVQIGGFDTHNIQVTNQANLLAQFSQAVRAFYDEMGVQNAQNDVTVFTMSDFSRTFNPAGTGAGVVGSDHAWGNHLFVIGGSVQGGDFYGINTTNGSPFPTLTMGPTGPDDTDNSATSSRGRWIPTTSVDQYAATLARWFGLAEIDQPAVFPNIANFSSSNLGFML